MAVAIRVTLRGTGQREFTRLAKDVRLGLQRTLIAEAPLLKKEMRRVLGPEWGLRSGRLYVRGGRRAKRGNILKSGTRTHRAAKVGEPPAKDTGALRRSVEIDKSNVRGRRVKLIQVGVTEPYGAELEAKGFTFLERSTKPLQGLFARYGRIIGLS